MKKTDKTYEKFLYETGDMLLGAAYPLMLQLIISASFIGLVTSLTEDFALALAMTVIGEILMVIAYVIFGRQSGIISVRKLVQHAKKREKNSADKQTEYFTGEYAPYKGFLIGFLSCIPYIIFQIIQCAAPNTFCEYITIYAFAWAVVPFDLAGLSPWYNLIFVIYPVIVHGVAYIVGAHLEWNKQQKVASLQEVSDKKVKK